MRALLKALGNPERLYPIVHVTGTNGKGSTASILSSVLRKAGYRTGLFTSPFLVKFNERIRIDGTSIPDADLIRLARQVQSACESIVQEGFDFPLEFEVVTALGYLYFAQQHVDIAVVEVGLGGLLDSTNTIDPLVSVITSIGFDHTHILGSTIEEIAAQKAGIIKAGRPVVVAPQVYPEALQVIASTAEEKHSALHQAQSPECTFVREGLILEDGTKLSMAGAHQAINLGCALETIRVLQKEGYAISSIAIHDGIKNARWDGRCQWVHDDLLIDGAHNSAGAAVLSDYLTEFASDRPIVMLFTAMRDKDVSSCIKLLAPHAKSVITCEIMAGRGERADVLAQQFSTCGAEDVQAICDPETAFAKATALAKECGGIVLCAGSLYLAGFILSLVQ